MSSISMNPLRKFSSESLDETASCFIQRQNSFDSFLTEKDSAMSLKEFPEEEDEIESSSFENDNSPRYVRYNSNVLLITSISTESFVITNSLINNKISYPLIVVDNNN